jgi:hypothetical protein
VTAVEIFARARVGGEAWVDGLVCHPRLPLAAGLDAKRPAVHVWDHGSGELREIATIGAGSRPYGEGHPWALRNLEIAVSDDRRERGPAVAWHPDRPLLLVAGDGSLVRWTPDGVSGIDGLPSAAGYRSLAFSPDGQALWASPSAGSVASPESWQYCSDAIDLASGAVTVSRWWDTGVAVHPGGLVVTLSSDQGATHMLFARVDRESFPASMRVLRRAVVLDADGYATPVLSADGRYLAIRGNAYENSLEVFEFPSLTRVLGTVLGQPHVSGGFSPERYREYRSWSRRNIAFGSLPGVLWAGTPHGTLVEIDLDNQRAAGHELLSGSPVTALCASAAGDLAAATSDGELVLATVRTESAQDGRASARTPQDLAAAFLSATAEAPDDGALEDHLIVTDGMRTWEPGDIAAVTTAAAADPAWLQHRAAINKLFAQEG